MLEENTKYFWFNRKTGLVEVGAQSLSIDRLGPFETRAEAERALEILAERARIARAEDESDWLDHHS
jgi:hypothetical protein